MTSKRRSPPLAGPAHGLGLDHGEVELAETDPRWRDAFERLARKLRAALGDVALSVEHVGSTAVPGLVAKPILDIAVGLAPNADLQLVVTTLEGCGFEYRGDNRDDGGRLFVLNSRPWHRVAHVHVVDHGDARWLCYLAFRDQLRRDGVVCASYAQVKRDLAAQFPHDRRSYTAAKASFIKGLLARPD